MSSDGYFDDDLDDAAFEELDAIEAAYLPQKQPISNNDSTRQPLTKENSFYDLTFDIDDSELEKLDGFIADAYEGKARPVVGPSKPTKTASKEKLQTTLFGEILQPEQPVNKPRSQMQKTKSAPRNPFGQQARKTKQWDQTQFAKSGVKSGKSKGKGKAKANYDDKSDESDVEFEQFPAPFVSIGPPPPMKLLPDLLEAKHWIYPLNRPKRDYQYNIVKHCLFDNTIVALPTGLGKTFIAGVVMLNYYRWFPEGKVVFVAPTKPLVAQQIDACHKTCGIPGSDATELTGQVAKSIRARHWEAKRVFYMTPQTLQNDLMSENCDARDIVLLVVDEAHKATGDYAYNQVVRYLMSKNPHFRVLALTATPGNTPDAVQALVDGLHISHIEIRDESSLDIKPYIFQKTIEQHIIPMNENIDKVKDLLVQLMDSLMKPLKQSGILGVWDRAATLHPYRAQARGAELSPAQMWARGSLTKISALARAMGYLVEGTMGMCHTYLKEIKSQETEIAPPTGKKAPPKGKKLKDEPLFQAVLLEMETQLANGTTKGFVMHPKMDMLKGLVVQHFGANINDSDQEGKDLVDETRVMVFVTFREAVDEIVEALNLERPLIRAQKFIGQGTDKRGGKGLGQNEQKDIIKKFQAGEFNVLVATSIGEEGLDIGEVDLIVCYDAQKTPIRMLQRSGRTGRKRAGVVHVLLSEGREEQNFDKAKATYKDVQKSILRGEQLELYGDVERLLPAHIKPECLEKVMEIEEYVREDGRKKTATSEKPSPTRGIKRKRNDDISRNIPVGASTGFVSVADLIRKTVKKTKATPASKDFDAAGEDDENDEELESGVVLAPLRRTKSAAVSNRSQQKAKPRRAATSVSRKRNLKGKSKQVLPSSSQLSAQGVDDENDLDLEKGCVAPLLSPNESPSSDPLKPTHHNPSQIGIIDLSDSESLPQFSPPPQPSFGSGSLPTADQDMAWLVDDDDELQLEIRDSSPLFQKHEPSLPPIPSEDESPTQQNETGTFIAGFSQSSDGDDSVMFIKMLPDERDPRNLELEDAVEITDKGQTPPWKFKSSPDIKFDSDDDDFKIMPPPRLPQRLRIESPKDTSDLSDGPFPLRDLNNQAKKRRIENLLRSPSPDISLVPQRRLYKRSDSTPARKRSRLSKRAKPTIIGQDANPLFDYAAVHSGDEVSEGHSNSEDDVESESDRLFLKDSPITQISPSYDQTLAYRQSLFTQAPIGSRAPAFLNHPVRAPGNGFGPRLHQIHTVSSSPPPPDEELDRYHMGSFVIDDDDDLI